MKRIVIGMVLSLSLWVGDMAVAAPKAHLKEIAFMVRGMVCSSCSASVEKALSKMDGVVQAKVDMGQDMAVVQYDERRVTPRQMTEALLRMGYKAQLAKR